MRNYTKSEIFEIVKKEDVKFIRLQFTDILGQLKSVALTVSQLEKALNNECMFDGSSIEGFVRIEESDMYLYPDLNTFTLLPWHNEEGKIARFICDIYTPDKKPFEGDPRYVLKKVLQKAEKMGYKAYVGPEMEFFLYNVDKDGLPTLETTDQGSYFDMSPVAQGGKVRRACCNYLDMMGFQVETSHHENSPAQHEIDFKYDEALFAADNIMTLKLTVRAVAKKYDMWATFMPKPKFGINGSGMHMNISLFDKKGNNVFYDENADNKISKECNSFIAGVMEHIKEATLFTNPLVNSYKRLVPGYEAPVYIAWSDKNRSPLIRIPSSRSSTSTRIELRNPDASCNPYLAIAAVIAAGLDGMEKKLSAPESVPGNIFEMNQTELSGKSIETLPQNLAEAIYYAENSSLMNEVMGKHVMTKYLEAKKREWHDFTTAVTDWEIHKYLLKY